MTEPDQWDRVPEREEDGVFARRDQALHRTAPIFMEDIPTGDISQAIPVPMAGEPGAAACPVEAEEDGSLEVDEDAGGAGGK